MRRPTLKPLIAFALVATVAAGCQTPRRASPDAQGEVGAVLEHQVREWNAGSLAGFMGAYAKSERTRFASGGDVSLGWQMVLDRYREEYSDRAAMGTLTFSDLEVTALGPDTALAFGRWQLKREKDEPSGVFTLVFRNTPDGWRIVHDHTSAAEPK